MHILHRPNRVSRPTTARSGLMIGALVALFLAAGVDEAEARRLALVVGNAQYEGINPLKNAGRDAVSIAAALDRLGFEVTLLQDVKATDFWDRIDAFAKDAETADATLFYYAGHAFQMNGSNYLVPVDAKLTSRDTLRAETWSLDGVIARLQDRRRQTLIFLDACRNDPLPASVRGSGTADGLARLQTGAGTFVAFATEPGAVTYDGAGDAPNSPFTTALLHNIETPGISVSDMMIKVRTEVEETTLRRQVPWDQSSLREQFYFKQAVESRQELSEADYELLAQLTPEDRAKFIELLKASGFSAESLRRANDAIEVASANLEIVKETQVLISAPTIGAPRPVEDLPEVDIASLPVVDGGVSVMGATPVAPPVVIAAAPAAPTGLPPLVVAAAPTAPVEAPPVAVTTAPVTPIAPPIQIAAGPVAPVDAPPVAPPVAEPPLVVAGLPAAPVAPGAPSIPSFFPGTPGTGAVAGLPDRPVLPAAVSGVPVAGPDAAPTIVAGLAPPAAPSIGTVSQQPVVPGIGTLPPEVALAALPTAQPTTPELGADIGPAIRVAALTWETRGVLEIGAVDEGDRARVAGNEVTPDDEAGRALLAAIDPRLLDDKPLTLDADPRVLARTAQAELARLGCYHMTVDGSWGTGSRTALTSYFLAKREVPTSLEPTSDLVAQLRGESKVVCEARVARAVVPGKTKAILPVKAATEPRAGTRNPQTNRIIATPEQRKTEIKKGLLGSGSF